MAHVLVLGAGINGLSTAMLLARAGHRVTVLERDPHEPPADPDGAWQEWQRPGVNQFRMLHYLLPRWYQEAARELPDLPEHLLKYGATPFNVLHALPSWLSGAVRPDDDRFDTLAVRRPVLEAAAASCAAAQASVEIRRGVAVRGLLAGQGTAVPHVIGVRTDDGLVTADLVVDATGRRSRISAWLAAIGAAAPAEERTVNGFVYYGRHFRSADGALPDVVGPLLQHYAGLSLLTLPADNGTWGVGVVGTVQDRPLRALRDPARWMTAVRSYPLVAGWIEAEPLTGVDVMARLDDQRRSLVVDGKPVVTGVVTVGDSWACTNPSLGRGITMGLLHARCLRDAVDATTRPDELTLAFDAATRAEVEPLFRATVAIDGHRVGEIAADLAGDVYRSDDQAWVASRALHAAAMREPDAMRAVTSIGGLLETAPEVFADPAFGGRVMAYAGASYSLPGPDRAELLALLSS